MKGVLKGFTRIFRSHRGYQKKRGLGTQQRWQLIQSRIAGCRSLLDIGCETGLLTAAAADAGLLAIGAEANWDSLRTARKLCRPNRSLAFLHFAVTPESVEALPSCDVVLLLSVYHQWHRQFGDETARKLLGALGQKARRYFFFEPASKQSKYGSTPPDFVDRDERSIKAYNLRLLGELFGQGNVDYLGGTTAGRSEPFRYLFVIQAQGAS